ncbi:putative AP-1 adaptor complex subunit gamma [Paraphysoderma sedebokerense]|nr:putative AP-1 adaptor complex subunit gamma [Paraphysoderma sedebokerense]
MVLKLKDFIRLIRSCKTAADERGVVAKESASIRTSFKEEQTEYRHINVAKLLYIHMLGYPAQFGQMECVKLVASPRFTDKRLGYLGIMLLLDENQETLTLVTNSLKNDLNHSNMYIVGLALCTLGNISSVEMSRDLSHEVEKLMGSSNSYIRKKAALAALRIIRKVPDLQDNFLSRCRSLLSERNHGALLTGITLVMEMCKMSPEILVEFRKSVPTLGRHLKNLITSGFSPEHDVSGITDPFLQVKILRLLRLLGANDNEASEAMNDVLAQVATSTDGAKNVGNSILYECVLTILNVKSENSLRVLAVNILGKFLANKDNNIRYVSLQTLSLCLPHDLSSVLRHRSTILDCLRDPDISIRRRALELSFAIVNETNVRVMVRELLAFLEIADVEFKTSMVAKLFDVAKWYAPNRRWHLDTLIRVLKLAGSYTPEALLSQFIRLVTNTPELQGYAVHKLYHSLKADMSQEALVLAGVWCIGEFGDVLVKGGMNGGLLGAAEGEEEQVLELLESVLSGPFSTPIVKEYVVMALGKLTGRLTNASVVERTKNLIKKHTTSMQLELQQRSVELTNLFGLDSGVRAALLERMPILEWKEEKPKTAMSPGTLTELYHPLPTSGATPTSQSTTSDALLDLGGLSLGSGVPGAAPVMPTAAPAKNALDIMADIFGGAPAPAQNAQPKSAAPVDLMGLMGGVTSSAPKPQSSGNDLLATSPARSPTQSTFTAYASATLTITFRPTRDLTNPLVTVITASYSNATAAPISDINLQIAVPKTMKLAMQPLESNVLAGGSKMEQGIKVLKSSEGERVKLRLKVGFNSAGKKVDDIVEFAFPEGI